MPNSVTDIGPYAFKNCSAEIIWGDNPSITAFGDYAFADYLGESLDIPNSIVEIGDYAFANYLGTSLTIPEGVTMISEGVFSGCVNLTTVEIPNAVTGIGQYAFKNSSAEIVWGDNPSITKINPYAFAYYLGTSVVIPDGVTEIGTSIFSECSNLNRVELPEGLITIGEKAFYNCTKLTSIAIPENVTIIGAYAFNNCRASISFGNNATIKNIRTYAFAYYLGSSLRIPRSVESIGSFAFAYCTASISWEYASAITNITQQAFVNYKGTSIVIPNSVTSIAGGSFLGCSNLRSIGLPFVGASSSATTPSASTVFAYIFGRSANDPSFTDIQQYYSSNSSVIYSIPTKLQSVTINGGNILYGAFYNCTGLTNITLGSGVTRISAYAFYKCNNLSSLTFINTDAWYLTPESSYTGGEQLSVKYPQQNANNVTQFYYDYYWYKKQ